MTAALAPAADVPAVLSRLAGVRRTPAGWVARCPAHDDRTPSLSLWMKGERLLFKCHAGCSLREVSKAIGLPLACYGVPDRPGWRTNGMDGPKPKIIAEYDYRDEAGELLYQVMRMEPKDFRVRRPVAGGGWAWNLDGAERVIFRLPELLARPQQPVLIVEGEKDVLSLEKYGLLATTCAGGAGRWSWEFGRWLKGRRVVILPDNDVPGRDHAADVAGKLLTAGAAGIRVVALPGLADGGDVTDWLSDRLPGVTDDQVKRSLVEIIRRTPEWRPCVSEEGRAAA